MKKEIHPKYGTVKVSCSCGESFESRSTSKEDIEDTISVEITSRTSHFGKYKLIRIVDRTGTSLRDVVKQDLVWEAISAFDDIKSTTTR